MASKSLPLNTETWLCIPAIEVAGSPFAIGVAGTAAIGSLTAALVNEYLSIVDRTGANYTGAGGNITYSVKNDSKLGFTDSATDSDKSINDFGNVTIATSQNYDAQLTLFRDTDPTATGSNYNLANDCVRDNGIKYILFRRIGYAYNAAAATGQKYEAYYVETDNPIDQYGDGANQTIGATFITKSIGIINGTLA